MKKEKFYSAVYGLILLGTLIATSAMGQIAYQPSPEFDNITEFTYEEADKPEFDLTAIEQISSIIQSKLTLLKKNQVDLEKGKWIADISIDDRGNIGDYNVTGSDKGNTKQLLSSIIEDIDRVDPIEIDGVAHAKTVRIPVVIGRNY